MTLTTHQGASKFVERADAIQGVGRSNPRERARHYTIAFGFPVECLARLDLLELEVAAPNTAEARAIILRLLNVLTAVIRRPI